MHVRIYEIRDESLTNMKNVAFQGSENGMKAPESGFFYDFQPKQADFTGKNPETAGMWYYSACFPA